jgi:hypothetical protein
MLAASSIVECPLVIIHIHIYIYMYR